MTAEDDALATIRSWNWEGVNSGPVGGLEVTPKTRSLADLISELALNGHHHASNSVLTLLSGSKLSAIGDFKWLGFLGEHHQNEGRGEIPARRWQFLQKGLAMPRDAWGAVPNVSLEVISLVRNDAQELPVADWNWRDSRFSTATAIGELFDDDVFEEWFSAWEIEVYPSMPDADATNLPPASAFEANSGGRPPALDWEAAALEMAGRYYRGDLKPKSVADVIRAIQDWAGGANGEPPDTTVRPHAKLMYEAFKTWETD